MFIPRHSIERLSGKVIFKGIPVVKKKDYALVEGVSVMGDAPKVLVKK